jgi:serine phosphatase RsbU (regulator of sigma subunit)
VRLRLSFRAKLAIALLLLGVGTTAVALHFAWRRGRAVQLESLRSLLRTTTAAVSAEIDGDAHAALPLDASAWRDRRHARLRALAERLKRANPRFREVYTVSVLDPPGPGKGRFLLAEEPEEIGVEYDYARFPAMVRGLEGPSADEDLLRDEYGRTISGYAPIRASDGRVVGILGIDVDASTVAAMRSHLRWLLLWSGLAATALAGLAAWFLSRRIAKPVAELAAGTDRVAAGDFDARLEGRTGDEFERLFEQFNRMAAGLEDRQRLKQAMALAMEIQQGLLPASPPRVPGVDLAAVADYCDETGGDYFDWPAWPLPGGRVAITVGDVTGHGIGAALLMASGRAVLRSHAERGETPGEILAHVNRALVRDASAGKFMTLFYGVLDPAAGTLVWANAGQGGCAVRRGDGTLVEMPASAPPLGVVPDVPFPEARVDGLRPGDLVVLSTDGVWETAGAGGDLFGVERMHATVAAAAGGTAAEVLAAVVSAAARHRGDGPQTDDVTMVVARLTGTRASGGA